jgi:hypothetical protein
MKGGFYMGARWIKLAVLYLVIGIGVGLFMSSTLQLNWASAHAHVNLVGFVVTAIFGVIYRVYPGAGNNALGKLHFWLHNIGVPIFLVSTFLVQVPDLLGTAHIFTFLGGGAFGLGTILFIVNAFQNIHDSNLVDGERKTS